MQVIVNGETRDLETSASVADLLQSLGLASQPVAVEVNLAVVPRARHAQHMLADGDRIEIVTLVGGG